MYLYICIIYIYIFISIPFNSEHMSITRENEGIQPPRTFQKSCLRRAGQLESAYNEKWQCATRRVATGARDHLVRKRA